MESNWRPRHKPTHLWTPDFLIKKPKLQLEKNNVFNKWFLSTWMPACRRMQIDLYLSACIKFNFKWIFGINIKSDTLNMIEETVGNNFEIMATEEDSLNRIH